MSTTSIAGIYKINSTDGELGSVKKEISVLRSGYKTDDATADSKAEFSHLRFDVASYVRESEIAEQTMSLVNRLRFDVTNFINDGKSDISEMPVANEFEYLRFDVSKFAGENRVSNVEMPAR